MGGWLAVSTKIRETGCAVIDFRINFIKSFVIMMFIASQTLFEIVF